MRLLIDHGADVNAQDESYTTPLHLSSFLGIPEIAQLLIERGANLTSQDWMHRTPLHMASSWVSAKTVLLSIRRRADVNGQDDSIIISSHTILPVKTATVRLLIDHGAEVNAKDQTKSTPLHLASSVGSIDTVRLLIDHGAEVTAQDVHRMTPLHMAFSWVSRESTLLFMQ